MATRKVAVVTGSNKGIGYAIVKGLCEKYDGVVYLTARDAGRSQQAVSKLKALGYDPLFHQLDITDQISVNNFKAFIKTEHGGLDILINNAGVCADKSLPMGEQAERNVTVNYFGTLKICEALFPLLRADAKVVNVSSSSGHLHRIPSADLQAKFKDPSVTIDDLSKLMKQYMQSATENRHKEDGWGDAYVVSKVGVSALTVIQQRIFDQETPYRNISVNSVHPGWIRTDMNPTGPSTIEEGAKSTLFAALETDLKGKYIWNDCRMVDWDRPL